MVARPQFAVVREDPRLEARLIERFGLQSAVVVASGGCTALTLARRHPTLKITAFDANPVQLEHCQRKQAERDPRRLNVGDADPEGLNQRGVFEGLFRVLRGALVEFVTRPADIERFFDGATHLADVWRAHPYWPTAFALAFGDPLLLTMFGPAALQHAPPGSYPSYFQGVFERGLAAPDATRNPFLQHVLLGAYRAEDAPAYIGGIGGEVTWMPGGLLDAPTDAGLYALSNIFDWSDDALVSAWAEHLKARAQPGTVVLLRQLNNTRDLRRFFTPAFTFDDALGAALHAQDRSLFYNRIEVGVRGSI